MRLIDADAMIEDAFTIADETSIIIKDCCDAQPTVDAVPVIRCKDCKHWYEKYRHGVDMSACKRAIGYFGANDYCSRAERKDND